MTATSTQTIRFGHSPDPDDAFMMYGFAQGAIQTGGLTIESVQADIQTLNEWAREGRFEVTAISLGAYAFVRDTYIPLPNGASIGDKYGPIVVTREPLGIEALRGKTIAVPGLMTTAYFTLRLALPDFEAVVVPFDRILDAVASGEVAAGLVIHEGQITYGDHGLHKIFDLGQWWYEVEGLPLPLGIDVIRRDLGQEVCEQVARLFGESIAYAMEHREAAVRYSMEWGRGLDPARTDRFVAMYVNQDTVEYGEQGRRGVVRLLQRWHEAGLIPGPVEVDIVGQPGAAYVSPARPTDAD
jgi:1,4-dihydroxy-6-naphthoate synthase